MLRKIIVAFIITFAFVLNAASQTRKAPPNWKEIKTCRLSFFVPNDFEDQKARGIDSCVAEFKGEKIALALDYGVYTDKPEALKSGEKRATIVIDRRKAILTTYRFGADVYIVKGRNLLGKVALGMWINGKTDNVEETVKLIFQNIRFEK